MKEREKEKIESKEFSTTIANVNTAVFCSAIKHKLSISVAQEVLK